MRTVIYIVVSHRIFTLTIFGTLSLASPVFDTREARHDVPNAKSQRPKGWKGQSWASSNSMLLLDVHGATESVSLSTALIKIQGAP